MVRDEEANLRANLHLWRPVMDFVVCGIDERTTDRSAEAMLTSELADVRKFVFYFRFSDFSQGRNVVLKEARRKFPEATHVLFADPDWVPESLVKAEVDLKHRSFAFVVYDRNGLTTRNVAWLAENVEGLFFKYRLHEVLVFPDVAGPTKILRGWRVAEREVPGRKTWHTDAHVVNDEKNERGHSQSYERYMKDLALLERDLEEFGPDDPHTLYYLGATHFAALEAMLGSIGEHNATQQTERHVSQGMHFLQRRADLLLSSSSSSLSRSSSSVDEQTWAAMRWLAHAYHFYRRDDPNAIKWYHKCHDYDPSRVDCLTFLASLHRRTGRHDLAWQAIFPSLATDFDEGARVFGHNFYVYNCSLPVEASLAILAALQNSSPEGHDDDDETWRLLLHFGGRVLLDHIDNSCDDPKRQFISARPTEVHDARRAYHTLLAGTTPMMRTTTPCVADVPAAASNLLPMMRKWGLATCASS